MGPLPIHCGYTALDMASPRASLARGMAALRLALALGEPVLSDRPMNLHRQAQARLDAMQNELNAALAAGALREERRTALVAALLDFPAEQRHSVACSVIWQCAAGERGFETALLRLQPAEPTHAGTPQKAGATCDTDMPSPDIRPLFASALAALFSCGGTGEHAGSLTQQAADYLRLHFAEPLSLAALAEHLHVTPAYLSALFHREMGRSYSQHLLMLRMEDAARRLLADPSAKVHAVGEAVGFPAAKHFTHVFGQYFGLSPRAYREKRGKG
jgi:AraC-like DNA-binding protein